MFYPPLHLIPSLQLHLSFCHSPSCLVTYSQPPFPPTLLPVPLIIAPCLSTRVFVQSQTEDEKVRRSHDERWS